MYNWYNTSFLLSALAENALIEVMAGVKKVGITRRGDKVYAFAALCPHQSAPLCDGWVDGAGRIVCPLHKYRFDPANGRNTTGEGYKLFTYPVEVRDDEIFVGLLV